MITPPSEPNIVSLSLSLSLSALSFLGGIVKERRKIKAGAFPRKSFVSFRISSRSFAINFLGDDVGNNLAILFEMSEFLSVSESNSLLSPSVNYSFLYFVSAMTNFYNTNKKY